MLRSICQQTVMQRNLILCLPCAGEAPSVSAYGAIVAGFARRQDAQAGLEAFRRFLSAGGAPDRMMYDTILSLCIKCELYKSARQVRGPRLRTNTSDGTLSCNGSHSNSRGVAAACT